MKKLHTLLLAAFILGMVACKKKDDKNDPIPTVDNSEMVTLSGEISSDMTLDASKKYLLSGLVYVTNGAKLSIPAGTVLYGDKLTKAALVITRGSKIDAIGTPDKPIVFTSNAPAGFRNTGDWAGVVVLGKAENNLSTEEPIEGITSGTSNGLHGGNDNADNSGTLQYVRIEFAGIALSPDNELNSLTMGSVGSGTTIDHIMVSYAGDDAYEWFGGTVSSSHLIAYNTVDDDFDTDMGYTGTVEYGIVVRDPSTADVSGSNAFESDNNKNTSTLAPITAPVFNYITAVGPYAFKSKDISANFQHGGHLRRGSNIVIKNSIIVGWPIGVNFDNAGANVNLDNIVIGKNKDVASSSYIKGTAPGSANIIEVGDMNTIFNGDSWRNLAFPDVSSVSATYNNAGAFAGSANWNWSSGWIEFDPINKVY
jgi:hypothetical protein